MVDLRSAKRNVPNRFNKTASRYDLLTALNPGYNRHLELSARRLGCAPNARLLDLCCGTGLSTAALRKVYPLAEIVALDASQGMLDIARQKAGLRATFVLGDATDPAAAGVEGSFDGILMAYGIRNLPDPNKGLRNLFNLLRPGGTVAFHEYSVNDSMPSKVVWNTVCSGVIIPSGFLFTGDAGMFRYLQRSVNTFDGVRAFEERLRNAGFVGVHTEAMDGWQRGIVHTFIARRAL